MTPSKGLSPVIASAILIGAVLIIGVSFMSYTISLADVQRYEIGVRSLLAEEASKVALFLERDVRLGANVTLYLGIAKVVDEPAPYYLAVLTASRYELASKIYSAVTPLRVRSFNGTAFHIRTPVEVRPDAVYVISASGDYVPIMLRGIRLYDVPYRQVNLVEVTCSYAGLKEYLVVMLLTSVGDEYYELLQLSYRVGAWS